MNKKKTATASISARKNSALATAKGGLTAYGANRAGIYRPTMPAPKPTKKPGISCPTSKQANVLHVRWLNSAAENREITRWTPEIAVFSRKLRRINGRPPQFSPIFLINPLAPKVDVPPRQVLSKRGGF
jgi:hypothetical protein